MPFTTDLQLTYLVGLKGAPKFGRMVFRWQETNELRDVFFQNDLTTTSWGQLSKVYEFMILHICIYVYMCISLHIGVYIYICMYICNLVSCRLEVLRN